MDRANYRVTVTSMSTTAVRPFTTAWKFVVRPDRVAEFERHYDANGTWVALFRRARGFVRTELYRGTSRTNEFVTIDVWESEEAYHAFRATYAREYEALDREMEGLTVSEEKVESGA
jgi:heme-degrading monooxygenase HmoA